MRDPKGFSSWSGCWGRGAVLSAVLLAAAIAKAGGSDPEVIDADALKSRLAAAKAPLVIDVRTPEEYAKQHLPGAINVPWSDEAEAFVKALPPEAKAEVIFYCNGPT